MDFGILSAPGLLRSIRVEFFITLNRDGSMVGLKKQRHEFPARQSGTPAMALSNMLARTHSSSADSSRNRERQRICSACSEDGLFVAPVDYPALRLLRATCQATARAKVAVSPLAAKRARRRGSHTPRGLNHDAPSLFPVKTSFKTLALTNRRVYHAVQL